MSKYQSLNHSKFRVRYHLIFSTKYRRKCLIGLEDSLIESFKRIEDGCDITVYEVGVDGDHVHLIVGFKPSLSVAQVVARLKQLSTRDLWHVHEDVLSRFYWGPKQLLWTHGYFCETVGSVSEGNVLEYVRNQGNQALHMRG